MEYFAGCHLLFMAVILRARGKKPRQKRRGRTKREICHGPQGVVHKLYGCVMKLQTQAHNSPQRTYKHPKARGRNKPPLTLEGTKSSSTDWETGAGRETVVA
jgi:hypothetical protein